MTQGRPTTSVEDHLKALAGSESTAALYSRLSAFLQQMQSLPAILYLRTGDALIPVAGFDCSREVPALPLSSLPSHDRSGELPANQVQLILRGEVVGLLAIFGRLVAVDEHMQRCALIVAVKLRHLVQEEALRRELHLAHEQLAHLVAAGELLSQLDVEQLAHKILESVLGAVRVPIGAVMVQDPRRPTQPLFATWGMRDSAVLRLRLKDGSSLVEECARRGQVLHFSREELRLALADPPAQLGGLVALPLQARGRPLGVVVLADQAEI